MIYDNKSAYNIYICQTFNAVHIYISITNSIADLCVSSDFERRKLLSNLHIHFLFKMRKKNHL